MEARSKINAISELTWLVFICSMSLLVLFYEMKFIVAIKKTKHPEYKKNHTYNTHTHTLILHRTFRIKVFWKLFFCFDENSNVCVCVLAYGPRFFLCIFIFIFLRRRFLKNVIYVLNWIPFYLFIIMTFMGVVILLFTYDGGYNNN